jgi:excinuclease ABC subunit B
MQRAMDETSRRRELQMQYNKDNNIKPVSIKKDIRQALDEDSYIENDALDNLQLVSSSKKKLTKVNSNNVTSIISQLEKEMYNHAKNLEFEQAAKIRDQINELQQKYLMFPKAKS